MKRAIPWAAVAMIAVMVGIANFSEVESRYRCDGTVAASVGPESRDIYLIVTAYRWWVDLWSDSDGMLWVEVPREPDLYFEDVRRVGDHWQVFKDGENVGDFSTLSGAIFLQLPIGIFTGTCRNLDPKQ